MTHGAPNSLCRHGTPVFGGNFPGNGAVGFQPAVGNLAQASPYLPAKLTSLRVQREFLRFWFLPQKYRSSQSHACTSTGARSCRSACARRLSSTFWPGSHKFVRASSVAISRISPSGEAYLVKNSANMNPPSAVFTCYCTRCKEWFPVSKRNCYNFSCSFVPRQSFYFCYEQNFFLLRKTD